MRFGNQVSVLAQMSMLFEVIKLAMDKVLLVTDLALKQHSFRGFRLALSSEQSFKLGEVVIFGGCCWRLLVVQLYGLPVKITGIVLALPSRGLLPPFDPRQVIFYPLIFKLWRTVQIGDGKTFGAKFLNLSN